MAVELDIKVERTYTLTLDQEGWNRLQRLCEYAERFANTELPEGALEVETRAFVGSLRNMERLDFNGHL